jgi:prepilin signal peptidase PulO-like enzyme (type II secretory pathway)
MQLILVIVFFMLGAIIASFVGVISERMYTGQSWLKGRSRCNSCRRILDHFDLVPVFSWLVHKGRCRTCKARLPITYMLSEASLGFLFALSYIVLGLTLSFMLFICVLSIILFIVMYDLRHTIVPWGSAVLLILFSILFSLAHASLALTLQYGVIALCICIGFLLLHFFFKGKAMGLGDAPVVFALSILVGNAAVPGLLFSFWIGAVIGIGILVFRRGGPTMGIEVPFVPFLALGYLLAFFTQWNPLL